MADDTTIARPSREAYEQSGAAIQRSGFGETSLERRDRVGLAMAERTKAEIQARYIVAMQRPRDLDEVRIRLLKHCKRPGFAAIAEYAKPIGKDRVTGPSIRFVETALQEFGNNSPECTVVDDDEDRRVVRVTVTDNERNVSYQADVVVEKHVERRNPTGYDVLGTRTNSYGDKVYRVRATEDDLLTKQSAIESKKIRTLGLRILPADIVDECMAACRATRKHGDAADPEAARKRLADAFAALGITPKMIEEYLGHPFAQCTPDELDELRAVGSAVKDGEARWPDAVESKRADRGEVDETSKGAADAASKVRERMAARGHVKEPSK